MKIIVKTLTGGKFEVQVEESNTVAEVKTIVETVKSDLPAAQMKLIKSGKVLKDEDVLSAIGVQENDFLVVMINKAKKAAAPAAAAATPAPVAAAPKTPAPAAAPPTPVVPTPATTTATPAAPPAPAAIEFPAEAIANLTSMGFPEEEARHCLRAALGNPDLAVEFLTNGIPEGTSLTGGVSSAPTPAAGSSSSSQPLQALRNHPQFNDLRRLVQSNPQMLQQVLGQIGQQQPQLLQEINANQALFLQMMNEPVTESSSAPPPSSSSSAPAPAADGGAEAIFGGMAGLDGPGNPAQMAEMINSMSAEELQQMSQMMGLTPEQLRATAQVIGRMPPEQLQQFMGQVMGGAPGGMGGGGGPGGPGGATVLRLTDEEMAAVDRLTEMGFDRAEAAQAFLACDKNEALAANLLMDSMGDDGGAFFGGGGGGSGGDNGDNNDNNQGDDDEDMYD
jgi:UV excision repair protein RAD23